MITVDSCLDGASAATENAALVEFLLGHERNVLRVWAIIMMVAIIAGLRLRLSVVAPISIVWYFNVPSSTLHPITSVFFPRLFISINPK